MADAAPIAAPQLQGDQKKQDKGPSTAPTPVINQPLPVPSPTQTLSPVPPVAPPSTPIPAPFTIQRLGKDKKTLALAALLSVSGLLGRPGGLDSSSLLDSAFLSPSSALELSDLQNAQASNPDVTLTQTSGQFDSGGTVLGGNPDGGSGGPAGTGSGDGGAGPAGAGGDGAGL